MCVHIYFVYYYFVHFTHLSSLSACCASTTRQNQWNSIKAKIRSRSPYVVGWSNEKGRVEKTEKSNEVNWKIKHRKKTFRKYSQQLGEGVRNVCVYVQFGVKWMWNCHFMNCGNNHKHCQYKILFLLLLWHSVRCTNDIAAEKKWWKSFCSVFLNCTHSKIGVFATCRGQVILQMLVFNIHTNQTKP